MLSPLSKSSIVDTSPEATPTHSVETKQTMLPHSNGKLPGWIFLPAVVMIVAILY